MTEIVQQTLMNLNVTMSKKYRIIKFGEYPFDSYVIEKKTIFGFWYSPCWTEYSYPTLGLAKGELEKKIKTGKSYEVVWQMQ